MKLLTKPLRPVGNQVEQKERAFRLGTSLNEGVLSAVLPFPPLPILPGVKNFLAHVIVSVDETEDILGSLDTHKAIGHDKLPT